MDTGQTSLWKINEELQAPPHIHENDFQITVPVHGSCHIFIDNKTHQLSVGEGLVVYPKENHELLISPESSVIVIQVNHSRLAQFIGNTTLDLYKKQRIEPEEIKKHFRRWASVLLHHDAEPLATQETEHLVLSFLVRMFTDRRPMANTANLLSLSDRNIASVLEFMHEHYKEKLNLDTLSSIALQSRYHFIRSFKSIVGITPYQYLLRLRIEEAKVKLRGTNMSITDISFELGFSSMSQFYRAFIKVTGTSPERYRGTPRGGSNP